MRWRVGINCNQMVYSPVSSSSLRPSLFLLSDINEKWIEIPLTQDHKPPKRVYDLKGSVMMYKAGNGRETRTSHSQLSKFVQRGRLSGSLGLESVLVGRYIPG